VTLRQPREKNGDPMTDTNPVRQLLVELGAGRVSMPEAITQLETLLVPVHRFKPADSIDETYKRMNSDVLPPWTEGSWDEVNLAAQQGVISAEQVAELRAKVEGPPPAVSDFDYS
jgi:hypothetical protein